MDHSACWSKVPYELALCIFQNVTQNLSYAQQKQNLANFELVCKSWKSPAQRLLYDEIVLSEDRHGLALNTIEKPNSTIGALVRKIKFKASFDSYRVDNVFDVLADKCPNIEELLAESTSEKYSLLNNLLLTTKFSHLKRIDEDLHHRQVLPIYPFVAFKYRETLTEIYIDDEYVLGDYDSKETLIRELGHFKSLKQVIITLFMTGQRMERILGNLRGTVETLILQHTQDSEGNWRALDYNNMVPNTTIKKLSITEGARHGPRHTEYFKFKFKALECFESVLTDLEQEADIPYLDFIMSIDAYNVNITINENARNRIDNIIKHAAKKETSRKNKEFELDFDYMPPPPAYDDPYPYAQYNWNLDLIKTKKSSSVKLHYIRENTDDDPLERSMFMNDVSNWLAVYSPTVVRIYNIEPMADHYAFLLENQHRPEFSTVAYVRRYFAWLCRDKSWQLLDDAISALVGKKGYVLSIGELVLCDEPASTQLMMSKSETVDYISRVEIRKSLIHYKLLSLLSCKLPRMDTLMIDSSWILMDDDIYTLKIFLPSTRLRRIGVVIAPFNYGTGDQTERIILDNDRLLEATTSNGRYILKIESSKERYMSYRKGNENIGNVDKDKDITKGTEQNFLIWIKCEHVEEFTIVGGLDEDVNWQPTFEDVNSMR
ncbi:cyclin-like protein interacting with PHO85 [Mucor velutinosus]|uniref:Cyclin-like protein interacting with PHO85 n=1 Tax=Mucor velutinosus TaxID=708070 RepID=A0AAN7DCB7_9FUNG|nr:cyclin-like protein interacting with PHO85 [Mucor velutinosus]